MLNKKNKEYKWWQIHEKIHHTTNIEYLEKQIKNYYYAALVWSGIFIITIIVVDGFFPAIYETIIDSIMIWGIYKKKEWATIAFLAFFVVGRIITFIDKPMIDFFTIYILILFRYFYVGMLSVSRWNNLKKENKSL